MVIDSVRSFDFRQRLRFFLACGVGSKIQLAGELDFEAHKPMLFSYSDWRSKFGGELSDLLGLTEILSGMTKHGPGPAGIRVKKQ
ncbi:hypothetical protein O4D10_21095 [Xanthomonas citri pv. citri]|uniref:hypothetical protein n=1 Tax=Xanthomonas citri TaxID=346 RepID=UPI0036DB5EFC